MASLTNKKRLKIVITLGTGGFGDNDQIILEGYRVTSTISLAGGLQMGQAHAQIYGLRQSDMDAITSYAIRVGAFKPNLMVIYAIDGPQESLVFTGNIVTAWADYQGMPSVYLDVQAQAAAVDLLRAVPPRSFKGAIDVASVMQQIAASMGYALENNGVTTQLQDVYLANTGMNQARDLAAMAGITFFVDNKTIVIAPKGVARKSVVPLISAETGMVGYPTFDGVTVICRTLFNPGIVQGGKVKIKTDVQRAVGEWLVLSIDLALDSEVPGGQWFTTFRAVNPALYGQ